jgi:glycerate kinase
MNILIAPNAFKNSLTAEEAASAMREGFTESKLHCKCECFPIGDGGDGTGELIIKKCNGRVIQMSAHDALGRSINITLGIIENGKTAVIEMASASGIALLKNDELNPLVATSYGTGEQMIAALDQGVQKIILAMGGSATVDGGCGILKALGGRFLNAQEEDLKNLPQDLIDLDRIDVSGIDKRISNCEVFVLCDVDNLLLGDEGAASMYGPQKGASPTEVRKLDAALRQTAQVIERQTGKNIATVKYGGTAGGAAAALVGIINAQLVNGIEYFLDLTGFDDALQNMDLVVTGEGSMDDQTLQGKGPYGVARRAKMLGMPVIALAGNIPKNTNKNLHKYFDALLSIGNEPCDLETALKNSFENLRRTAMELGNLIAVTSNSSENNLPDK